MTKLQLRKQLFKDPDVGDLARDIQEAINSIATLNLKTVIAPYTEPFYLKNDREPAGCLLIRVKRVQREETPILTGGLCHYVWEGNQRRLKINSIDGMTPSPGVLYHFAFLMVG